MAGGGGDGGGAALQSRVSWQADIPVLIGGRDQGITEILSPVGSPLLSSAPDINHHFSLLS